MRSALALAATVLLLVPASASAKTLVRYDRSGFRAPSVSLTVDDSRTAKTSSDGEPARRFKVSRKRFRSLKRALSAARFADLADHYEDEGIADGFTETVTYRGKTVTVREGGDPPERLIKVLTRLRALAQ